MPEEGTYWNTLGAAYVRVRNWEEASTALLRSMKLRDGEGDAYDWFFLAMIDARKGDKRQARAWYDRAVDWFHDGHEADEELYRFQAEAAAVLNLPRPPLPDAQNVRLGPVPDGPLRRSLRRRARLEAGVAN